MVDVDGVSLVMFSVDSAYMSEAHRNLRGATASTTPVARRLRMPLDDVPTTKDGRLRRGELRRVAER